MSSSQCIWMVNSYLHTQTCTRALHHKFLTKWTTATKEEEEVTSFSLFQLLWFLTPSSFCALFFAIPSLPFPFLLLIFTVSCFSDSLAPQRNWHPSPSRLSESGTPKGPRCGLYQKKQLVTTKCCHISLSPISPVLLII